MQAAKSAASVSLVPRRPRRGGGTPFPGARCAGPQGCAAWRQGNQVGAHMAVDRHAVVGAPVGHDAVHVPESPLAGGAGHKPGGGPGGSVRWSMGVWMPSGRLAVPPRRFAAQGPRLPQCSYGAWSQASRRCSGSDWRSRRPGSTRSGPGASSVASRQACMSCSVISQKGFITCSPFSLVAAPLPSRRWRRS